MIVPSVDCSAAPEVSIVVATFNRAAVLSCALRSVIRQTFTRWELIVVGDACTDESEAVVAALGDPRIRWHNLPQNTGDQSGPNSVGMAMARAPLIAFLNHDDLWLPHHLQISIDTLRAQGADLVFSLLVSIRPDLSGSLLAAVPDWTYDPRVSVPASTWLFRRRLYDDIGDWVPPGKTFLAPSQQWLFRAHRQGAKLVPSPHFGVVAVQSGFRPGCYRDPSAAEHETLLAGVADPAWQVSVLARAAAPGVAANRAMALSSRFIWLCLGVWFMVARFLRVHPDALLNAVRHGSRGGLVRRLRRLRGLNA